MTSFDWQEHLRKIHNLHLRKEALLEELARSLTIKDLLPGAFDNGPVTSAIHGSPHSKLVYKIRDDVTGAEFDLIEVPYILWRNHPVVGEIKRVSPGNKYRRCWAAHVKQEKEDAETEAS